MSDITRLEAIDALLPEGWERDGSADDSPSFDLRAPTHGAVIFRIQVRRKRPATVTLEGVPVEWAEWLRDGYYSNEGDDWKVAKEAARLALEALKKEATA